MRGTHQKGQEPKTETQAKGAPKPPAPAKLWPEWSALEVIRLWFSCQMTGKCLPAHSLCLNSSQEHHAGEVISETKLRFPLEIRANTINVHWNPTYSACKISLSSHVTGSELSQGHVLAAVISSELSSSMGAMWQDVSTPGASCPPSTSFLGSPPSHSVLASLPWCRLQHTRVAPGTGGKLDHFGSCPPSLLLSFDPVLEGIDWLSFPWLRFGKEMAPD